MIAPAGMADRVAAYLAERRRNGFGMSISGSQLAAFARYADGRGHSGPITLVLASEWALSSEGRRPLTAARRIEVLRGFAKFCLRYDPATVVPPRRLFGRSHRRLRPHIYTDAEITRLMLLARKLGGLRGATCATIFGLIAACGLRISEATRLEREFEVFLHAPFKDDQAANKNNTSLSMNVVLHEGDQSAQFFFFGDREYPTTKRIFEDTETYKNTPYLQWDVMLCSHHCSKGVMYWQGEGDEEEVLKQDILDFFEKYAKLGAVIVASAHSKFTDESGANPPHLKARKRYEEIVAAGNFICTHEYPSKAEPKPLIFVLDEKGLKLDDQRSKRSSTPAFGAAVKDARGIARPPGIQVGFGRDE